jgi:hypothetical protein
MPLLLDEEKQCNITYTKPTWLHKMSLRRNIAQEHVVLQYHLIFSLYATFNMIFVSIGHLQVLRALFIYANILEAMAVGHFSYRPKFTCCNGDRHEQNLLKYL